jgi:hypothetical protein
MDVYCQAVLDLEGRTTEKEPLDTRRELDAWKRKAIRQLQEEQLEADASFLIFLDLVHHRLDRP